MARAPAKQPEVFRTDRQGHVRATTGLRRALPGPGAAVGAVQPIDSVVYDGDTIQVHLLGSGSLRFLGIDTAELKLNNSPLNSDRHIARFGDPAILGILGIDPGLKANLAGRIGADTALNQFRHAQAGQRALREMVKADIRDLGQTPDSFRVYLEFSYEVFDSNGRFLVFVNRDQPRDLAGVPRPLSYNERMLAAGMALPYFIWPNIAPFRDAKTVTDAIPAPGTLGAAARNGRLGLARRLVKAARAEARAGDGKVYDPQDPQLLEAFELRFLDKGQLPHRGVIDLSGPSRTILRPQSYWQIPNPEDRLFIPSEFVPAFAARGWRLEGW